jgi:hypothetical protein
MNKAWGIAITCAAVALPWVASAQQSAPKTLKELVTMVVNLLNSATALLVLLALVIFLFGASVNIFKSREQGSGALGKFLMWGVIILFVMVSIWGILRLLQNTLFSDAVNSSTGVPNQPCQNGPCPTGFF